MIISQDGKTAVADVKEAQLLNAGADVLLVVNGKTMGKFKNKKFADDTFQKLLQFSVSTKKLFEVPADF